MGWWDSHGGDDGDSHGGDDGRAGLKFVLCYQFQVT